MNCELDSLWKEKTTLPLGVDQEGGRVQRINNINWPSARQLAELSNPENITTIGEFMSRELMQLGFNVDFVPVLDIFSNPENKVIGDRAFGTTAPEVSTCAALFLDGFRKNPVATCSKHFPGHGNTLLDSHKALPHDQSSLQTIINNHLIPFENLAQRNEMLMTAHVVFPELDNHHPASLSNKVLDLINQVRFKGVVVSDDLEMGALHSYPQNELAYLAFLAGNDMVMVCSKIELFHQMREFLLKKMENNSDLKTLINLKINKVRKFKNSLANNTQKQIYSKKSYKLFKHDVISFLSETIST
ncbi:MAG: glycoside hydrolase family 3 N-terminal domain-containing protein [Myxococcota bacterium]